MKDYHLTIIDNKIAVKPLSRMSRQYYPIDNDYLLISFDDFIALENGSKWFNEELTEIVNYTPLDLIYGQINDKESELYYFQQELENAEQDSPYYEDLLAMIENTTQQINNLYDSIQKEPLEN